MSDPALLAGRPRRRGRPAAVSRLNAMSLDAPVSALRRVRWLGAPLNLLLLLGLAALLAHWTWRFAAPVPPLPASSADAGITLDTQLTSLHAAHLFGAASGRTDAPAGQATALELKLRGVFAARDGKAMAIVGGDGPDRAVAPGEEIVPGVVLDAIAPDHLVLLNRGVRERLDLDALGRPLALADGDTPVSRQEFRRWRS